MSSTPFALIAFVALAASGSAGLAVGRRRRRLPGGALAGFVGLLCLLVAALAAVALAGARDAALTRGAAVRQLAVAALSFDLDMKLYGPEAASTRESLRADLALARALLAGEATATASAPNAAYGGFAAMRGRLAALTPASEAQRRQLASAEGDAGRYAAARLDLALQTGPSGPTLPGLGALACACVAFFGLGSLGRAGAAAVAALLLCAGIVAGTYYVTMGPDGSFPGFLGGAPGALDEAMAELGR